MSKIIEFDKYFVREMNYQVKEIELEEDTDEKIEVKNKFKLGVKKSLDQAFIEMDTDVSTDIKGQEFRILNLRVRFFFKVSSYEEGEGTKQNLKKEIADELNEYGVSICEVQIRDIIKQITSIDYNTPIMIWLLNI